MPIVTIEYNLPEEEYEYDCARRGADYESAIDNLYNWLRCQYKYNAGEISADAAETVAEWLRNELAE